MDKPNLSELGYNQLPHYNTHAIEHFEHFAKELPVKMGISADYELLLAGLLRDSVKFLLPDNGYLFADHDLKRPVAKVDFPVPPFSPTTQILITNLNTRS